MVKWEVENHTQWKQLEREDRKKSAHWREKT